MKNFLFKLLHLRGLKYKIVMFSVNHIFAGTNPKYFELKRKMLNSIGFNIGKNTKIVAPINCSAKLSIGENCWINHNFAVEGNGSVSIGNNCDIAPNVSFQTGGHKIGNAQRRAGEDMVYHSSVGNGCWICANSNILGNVNIGNSCVIAASACVTQDVPDSVLAGGVPAKILRSLK